MDEAVRGARPRAAATLTSVNRRPRRRRRRRMWIEDYQALAFTYAVYVRETTSEMTSPAEMASAAEREEQHHDASQLATRNSLFRSHGAKH